MDSPENFVGQHLESFIIFEEHTLWKELLQSSQKNICFGILWQAIHKKSL